MHRYAVLLSLLLLPFTLLASPLDPEACLRSENATISGDNSVSLQEGDNDYCPTMPTDAKPIEVSVIALDVSNHPPPSSQAEFFKKKREKKV